MAKPFGSTQGKDIIKEIGQEVIIPPEFSIPANRRIGQTGIMPTAVKNRQFGEIIQLGALISSTVTLSNGDQTTFTITTTPQTYNNRILALPDITLYVGSVADNNRLPGGSAVTASQWQIIFLGNDYLSNDGYDIVTKVFVRNISAGASKDVILNAKRRALTETSIL